MGWGGSRRTRRGTHRSRRVGPPAAPELNGDRLPRCQARRPVAVVNGPFAIDPGNEAIQPVEHIIDLDAGLVCADGRSTNQVFDL
jgi:hypothetical protein